MARQKSLSLILTAAAAACLIAIFFFWKAHSKQAQLSKMNVLLIVVDTLGEKHLHISGKEGTATPFLDEFAASSVQFTRAYSPAPWTKPAIASILTGSMPSVHGLRDLKTTIQPTIPTMAELYHKRGYETAGVVSHIFLSPKTAFARGFDSYNMVALRRDVHDSVTSNKVTDNGIEWLESHLKEKPEKPFFLLLHYFDPHYNYQHHPDFDRTSWYKGTLMPGTPFQKLRGMAEASTLTPEDIKYLEGLYREELSYTDGQIAKLIQWLSAQGLDKNTLVIFTADHGEEFYEHGGIGHGQSMYDEILRVPLMFHFPGVLKPAVIDKTVSTLDILPTAWSFQSGAEAAPHWSGKSLARWLRGEDDLQLTNRTFFSEVDFNATIDCVMEHRKKLIVDKRRNRIHLYDLKEDPEEKNDIYAKGTPESDALMVALEKFRNGAEDHSKQAKPSDGAPSGAQQEEIDRLKSLGYL